MADPGKVRGVRPGGCNVDIAAWLHGLGLGQYEQVFRDNGVDPEILPHLTADDLRDMGVTAVGHRRKLLQAIGTVRGTPDGPEAPTAPHAAAPARPPEPTAERRPLTVMFVDLVGSTALAARLDPEEMGEVIRAYQNTVAGEVTRFEGHVAKYMGDGVLCYFGWPRAHEDEAERAVRAGLAIVEAVTGLRTPSGEPLTARVGIATGLVVVGELVGSAEARERTVVGETPNLAARLQALAEPGDVVISRRTRRLVGGLFELVDLGTRALKGIAEPVRAWRVVSVSTAESRFAARQVAGLTPLVGREQELALLLDRWQQAQDGEGQVVLLSGEPGIGKSRLVLTLRERLRAKPHTALSHYCSPFHQTSALYPVIGLLERAAGFARDDAAEQKLDKLEALLAQTTEDVAGATPLIAALLAIPAGARYPPLTFSPQRQMERTLQALLDQLAGLAARQPVLVLWEDVHWSDPTSLELLGLTVARVQTLPALVIVTFRPAFTPPWRGQAHITALTLNRLSRKRGAAMVAEVTGGKALPPEVLEQIVAKADGVPLFVEELTKTVLELSLLKDVGDRYELAGPLRPLAIPSSLHDSLSARLDRLASVASVKEVAQVGAAIGREFSYELLAAVTPLSGDELREALAQLAEAELVFRRGTPPEATYVFKHALVRDAAYQSLLRSKRQQLHARIVRVLEEHFPETVDTEPELLAQHCTEAGLAERAVDYWHCAGQRALARSATAEAVVQLTKGLEVLVGLPVGAERRRREIGLQLALGPALIAAKGYAAPETGRAYARACELCREADDTPELFPALYGQSVVHWQRAELAAAYELARELLRLAEERGDAAAEVVGHRILGAYLFQLGRLAESRAHSERALALYDPVRDQSSRFVYAIDSRVVCLLWLSQALLALGYPEQARARNGEVLVRARQLAHPNTIAQALLYDWTLHQLLRDRREAQEQAEALIALATEQGLPLWLAAGVVVQGWALAAGGRAEDGIAVIRRGLTDYRATGAELFSPYFLALLADAHGRADQAATGLSLLADALDGVDRTGVRWLEAELHRLRGELWLALPEPDQSGAEGCLRRALAVAREQDARMWELRAATSLARLWREQGKRIEARDVLAPVYGWFSEGFDTPDLKEAKALLEALR
jgi:class 3 adenylate cyclase/predicted ATPase